MATAAETDGPSFEPPQLPPGWIAQWDAASKKYYYVQISTGVSQWETPTEPAPGGTPAQASEHPYGVPSGRAEVITHPDGSQTVKHADGRMEPILPGDGTRGVDGPSGERGLGSMATNLLVNQLGGGKNSHGSGGGLGGLASSLLSGGGSHGSSHNSSNPAGKLVGQLASNLFSSGGKKPDAPQNYHGGPSANTSHSGGIAGAVMGGVANMFGGQTHGSNQNFGYSNSGQSQQGGYSGTAPPTSYQPPGMSSSYTSPPPPSGGASYGHSTAPQGQSYPQQHSYGSPPANQPQQQQYGGGGSGGQQYPGGPGFNSQYGNAGPPQGGQHSYSGGGYTGHGAPPPPPTGTHPNHGQPGGYPGQW